MADRVGHILGHYRLTHLLGQGGFAEVYLGEHRHLGTQAAIKVLHTHLALPADVEQFRLEARTVAALVHPYIVRVLDFDVEEGTPYLVMDYAQGGSLRSRMPPGTPRSPAEVLPVVLQVADALQYAHEQKFVHRDIKPENMLLGRRQEVLLSDFGIAVVAQSTSAQKTLGVAGTAAYMAPEQLQGKPRPASDLYSLGIVVYEWLCGERPFQGSFTEVASQHLFTPPPSLRAKVPTLPPALEQVVLTALAKDPKDRFGSVRAFATALAQASQEADAPQTISTRPLVPPPPASVFTPPQVQQSGASLFSATTQLTPHLTPQLSTPSQPGASSAPAQPVLGPGNQAGPSVRFAQTHLTPPTAASAFPPAGSGPSAGASPVPSAGAGVPISSGPQSAEMGPATYLPQGWAAAPSAPASPAFGEQERAEAGFFDGAQAALAPPRFLPVAPGNVPAGRRKGGFWRWPLVAAAVLVLLALLGGGAALVLPALLGHGGSSRSTATVTITPSRSDLNKTYTLTGVTGTPDASQQQVQARVISVTTPAHSQVANATGAGTTPGTHATGTLTFFNCKSSNVTIPAGSQYTGLSGVTAATEITFVAQGGAPSCSSYDVPAHSLSVGANSNMPPQDITACAEPTCTATVKNLSSFTGGTDPQPYTAVAQSDIDGASNSLIQANQPNAQQVVQGQLHSNEQLVGTPQCTPNVSSDHQAGDAVNQVNVTVTFTCTGEAYDHTGALALAKQLLAAQAARSPGAGYALVGQIKATLTSATISDAQQGTVTILVAAEGLWVYQFSAAAKHALATLVVGQSKSAAIQALLGQPGVADVTITLSGGDGQRLPTDAQQITLVVQNVSGVP